MVCRRSPTPTSTTSAGPLRRRCPSMHMQHCHAASNTATQHATSLCHAACNVPADSMRSRYHREAPRPTAAVAVQDCDVRNTADAHLQRNATQRDNKQTNKQTTDDARHAAVAVQDCDFLALSFVRDADTVMTVRSVQYDDVKGHRGRVAAVVVVCSRHGRCRSYVTCGTPCIAWLGMQTRAQASCADYMAEAIVVCCPSHVATESHVAYCDPIRATVRDLLCAVAVAPCGIRIRRKAIIRANRLLCLRGRSECIAAILSR